MAIGTVAKCKKGLTGLILGIKRMSHKEKSLYTGICLDRGRVGQVWRSIDPEFIGTFDDWIQTQIYRNKSDISNTPTRRNLLT